MDGISRRQLIVSGALAAGALAGSPRLLREALAAPARAGVSPYGALGPPDANGLMLPPGFTSREVARGLSDVAGYAWPVFSDAPWGTWLSCEEYEAGLVWECDPAGKLTAQPRPALGVFSHEAAAVEPAGRQVYLTEDQPDGGFYRFTPAAYPSLSEGHLQVAVVAPDGSVSWREVPDPTPTPAQTPTRAQVPEMTKFNGAEGTWHDGGILYITTKGDKRVWAYNARTRLLEVIYDQVATPDASLDAVDNITVSAAGEIFVCEDGGNMEIALITPGREVSPFLRFTGPAHPVEGDYKSEVCGVSFDPSGTRMYCTSQRAYPPSASFPGPGRSTRSAARSGCPRAARGPARSGCPPASAGAGRSGAPPGSCA